MAFASVSTTASVAVVPARAGSKVRLTSCNLVAAGAVTIQWRSTDGSGTVLSGVMTLATGAHYNLPLTGQPATAGYLESDVGTALYLVVGSSVQVSGHVSYEYIGG